MIIIGNMVPVSSNRHIEKVEDGSQYGNLYMVLILRT